MDGFQGEGEGVVENPETSMNQGVGALGESKKKVLRGRGSGG